jgi:outer membrane protein, multidrug efflux system
MRVPLMATGLALLAGCAGMPPPKAAAPELPTAAPLATSAAAPASAAQPAWPAREWWHAFGDPGLDALVAQALAASPDMGAAAARVAAARTGIDAARANSGLRATLNADAERQRLSDNGLFPPQFLGFNWYNQFDLGVGATWSPDWWGQHRAELAAAIDTTRAAEAEREAAALAIASSVANAWFGWQGDAARLALATQRVANAEQSLALVQSRVQANVERADALERAHLDLFAARNHVTELETSQSLRRVALAALCGLAPEALPPLVAHELPTPAAGLPANASLDLAARRPDLVAARWRVESAARERDIARTGFLPDFSLSAMLGLQSRDLGKLLEIGSGNPNAIAALHLPLFDGGALKARYAHSQAEVDAAVAAWRSTLLAAARDVNGQLVSRAGWLAESATREQQLAAATALRDSALARARAGLTDLRPALAATDQWLQLREAQELTRMARLGSEIELIRALGGGYRMDDAT